MGQGFLSGQAGGKKVAHGSFTPGSDITTPYTISGLGFNPTGGTLYRASGTPPAYSGQVLQIYDSKTGKGVVHGRGGAFIYVDNNSPSPYTTLGNDSITFWAGTPVDTYSIKAGFTYYWVAWAEE